MARNRYRSTGSSRIANVTGKKLTHQTAVIYDALSEGPIEGLVDGTNSI